MASSDPQNLPAPSVAATLPPSAGERSPGPSAADRGLGLAPADQALIEEEEALFGSVQRRLTELRGERQLRGDAGLRLQELRDEAATAHEEDLPALLDQLHVVRSVEERRRERAPLPEQKSPYFAHFRLRDQQGSRRDYLLGHVSLLDAQSGLRLLDWRNAPLSQLYYRFREGEFYEADLPGRRVEGIVEARRAVVVVEGELRAISAPQGRFERTPGGWVKRDEEDLPRMAGGSGSAQRGLGEPAGLGLGVGRAGRVRLDVSALLDPVQFDIVNQSGEGPLLVLGSAGSGKTTVALHRLAALHFQAPQRFPQEKLSVVVPELGLSRLIGRLLEPLGLAGVEVGTFTAFAKAELARLAPELPKAVRDEAPPAVVRLKRHRALAEALPGWLAKPNRPSKIETLRRELLTDRSLLREVVARANAPGPAAGSPPVNFDENSDFGAGDKLPLAAVEETVQRTLRQIAQTSEQSYRGIDADRLTAVDGQRLDAGTPEDLAQTLDTEDLPLLLELQRLTKPKSNLRRRAHLVIDEAQERCALELAALRGAIGGGQAPASLTVAGDDVQRTSAGEFDGWDLALDDLGVRDEALRRLLAVSYRCPKPIADLAQAVLGKLAHTKLPPVSLEPDRSARPGAPVGLHRFPHAGAQILAVQDALADLVAREPQASVAVLTRTAAAAERWAQALQHLPEARLVLRGDFTFEPGVDVCEVAEAKGLEFDYVLLPDADAQSYPDDLDARRALHVAITRAMHQLWLAHVGTPSPLLPDSLRVALAAPASL